MAKMWAEDRIGEAEGDLEFYRGQPVELGAMMALELLRKNGAVRGRNDCELEKSLNRYEQLRSRPLGVDDDDENDPGQGPDPDAPTPESGEE